MIRAYLGSVCATVSRHVPHNLRKILGVFDHIDMAKHLQIGELRRYARHPQRRDECMVRVQIRYHLEPASQGDDLPFEMLLQNPTSSQSRIPQ